MSNNKAILAHYIQLTEFLAKVIGPHYEISLYDLTLPNKPLIAIANRHISSRVLGEAYGISEKDPTQDPAALEQSYIVNYSTTNFKNRQIRTSTFFIKGYQNELIGVFCLHFDDTRFSDISKAILGLCHPDSFITNSFQCDDEYSNFAGSSMNKFKYDADIINMQGISDYIARIVAEEKLSLGSLSQEDKMTVISRLHQAGLMSIKGSIVQVAEELRCSASSVYRYLGIIKKE